MHDGGLVIPTERPEAIASVFERMGEQALDRCYSLAGYLGDSGNEVLASAELYDPTKGTFSRTGSLAIARSWPNAILLQNGRVLVEGGYSPNGGTDAAELYDPATGLFSPAGSTGAARIHDMVTLLPDGRVLLTGGASVTGNESDDAAIATSAMLYDPVSAKFTATGSMTYGRLGHTSTVLRDGRVLIVGGFERFGYPIFALVAEIFDPGIGKFSPAASLAVPTVSHTATLLPDGRVLIAGGYKLSSTDPSAAAEIYDPNGTPLAAPSISGRALSTPGA
jgi:hypothetical protein